MIKRIKTPINIIISDRESNAGIGGNSPIKLNRLVSYTPEKVNNFGFEDSGDLPVRDSHGKGAIRENIFEDKSGLTKRREQSSPIKVKKINRVMGKSCKELPTRGSPTKQREGSGLNMKQHGSGLHHINM